MAPQALGLMPVILRYLGNSKMTFSYLCGDLTKASSFLASTSVVFLSSLEKACLSEYGASINLSFLDINRVGGLLLVGSELRFLMWGLNWGIVSVSGLVSLSSIWRRKVCR